MVREFGDGILVGETGRSAAERANRAAKASAVSAEMSERKGKSGRASDERRPRRASMPSASPGGAGGRLSRGGRAAATRSMSRAVGRLAMITAERDAGTRTRVSQHRAQLSRTLRLNDSVRNNIPIQLIDAAERVELAQQERDLVPTDEG